MLDDESIENGFSDVIKVNADKKNEEIEIPDVNADEKEMKQRQMTTFFCYEEKINHFENIDFVKKLQVSTIDAVCFVND